MNRIFLVSSGLVLLGGAVWWSLGHKPRLLPKVDVSPVVAEARSSRRSVDELFGAKPGEAASGYREFIASHEDSKDPQVQDEVGNARLRLGFLAARSKDYKEAHNAFKEAEHSYKGTGTMAADFGGIKDQAAYQAAVCLQASGEKDAAYKAYLSYLKDYKLSPLVHAVHRRLTDMAPDKANEYDGLLQQAIAAQEKHIRFETSVCGPKCLAYILNKTNRSYKSNKTYWSYQDLARLCGTSDNGTTIDGLKKALKACGLNGIGYEVNRSDLLRLKRPAILLVQDHYVVLTNIVGSDAIVYDPMRNGEVKFPLPKPEQTDFTMTVLALEPLESN